jgi:glycosyltransferase involved in cell wall biosynthesis
MIKPDIVHGQGTERDCAVSAVFSGFPNVLTIHGNMRLIAEVNKAKPLSFLWLAAQLEKVTLPHTCGVVCISRYTQNAVKDLVPKTWVVPNAVDEAFFSVDAQRNASRTILCVGMVCHRKNQNAFIKALDPVAAQEKIKLLFLGGVNKEEAFGSEFLGLVARRSWCEYGGFANREDLRKHFKTASLLALPSLEDNCPMVVLEAMAAGVPVLAANVGGLPDLIEDGKNGIFCDPLDAASMRNGASRLLENSRLSNELVATARARARERFHPSAIGQQHVEIYREVVGEPS